jgi:cell fate regulator YaaT (PSP1 superfamily)
MRRHHLVRLGALGHVGRFTAVDAVTYPRGLKVILRTARGLEIGEILGPVNDAPTPGQSDGSILRGMTIEDQLLQARLEKNRQAAFDACINRIGELGLTATLIDVEHLFDGRSLFFHFLGEVPKELESLAAELAQAYDSAAEFRRFADTLTTGCGPGCGTEEASGGGCSSCATGCAVAGACGTRKR